MPALPEAPWHTAALNLVSHHYVFRVYALDLMLPTLPTFGNFLPGAEQLYQAMIAAGWNDDILDSASMSGFFPGR
jgi:phosphatidylethanolamine-binding protein (PEBP) family uncharacterized protein